MWPSKLGAKISALSPEFEEGHPFAGWGWPRLPCLPCCVGPGGNRSDCLVSQMGKLRLRKGHGSPCLSLARISLSSTKLSLCLVLFSTVHSELKGPPKAM